MNVQFSNFVPMHNEIRGNLDNAYNSVIDKSWFIRGDECKKFEEEFAEYCGVKYCVGVASGLDALILILKAMNIGKGDEVIVPSNTYIATALAVSYNGAKPVFVEPEIETFTPASKLKDWSVLMLTVPEMKIVAPLSIAIAIPALVSNSSFS